MNGRGLTPSAVYDPAIWASSTKLGGRRKAEFGTGKETR